ncbi:MAG: prepilin peptidase, partial [Acidobacteriaceae bacterium]
MLFAGVGIVVLLGHASVEQLGVIALLCIPLGAIVMVDMAKGLIPDLLTLVPLGALLLWTGLHGPWLPMLIGAAIPFGAFALSAALSKGRGMGWGDAKLAAFGGAILGLAPSLIAFALSSLVAV